MLQQQQITQQVIDDYFTGIEDHQIRREMAKDLLGFGLVYLAHHLYLPPGTYHREMVSAFADPTSEALLVEGFRGCTKSTWGSLILPIWAALVHPELYGFIILVSDTSTQGGMNIANIKDELENNTLIKQDFGTFKFSKVEDKSLEEATLESEEEWQSKNLLLSNDVRILTRSRGQKLRGLKHRQYRPRLVIVDDPEDSSWVKNKENRDTTEKWMNAEVMGCLDLHFKRLIVLGNLLHMDALLARMEKRKLFDKVLKIALFTGPDESVESCVWPAMYPNMEKLEKKKREMGPVMWQREMKLVPVPDEGQDIAPEDLQYYDNLPPEADVGIVGTGVDPAISKKATADCTAMVTGKGCMVGNYPKIFVMPNPINLRLDVMETLEQAKAIDRTHHMQHLFFVEDVAYQKALIQLMEKEALAVIPMKSLTDKRARLRIAATYIKNGTVQFPRTGCEDLIIQLLGFGTETHDDLCDGLVNMILGLIENGLTMPEVIGL